MVVKRGDAVDIASIVATLGLPVVVKPIETGSSVGMSIVRDEDSLGAAVEKALVYGVTAMIEAYIQGKEITCGVLGNEDLNALPLIEIIPGDQYEFFDFDAKYQPGATQEICPARIDDTLTRRAQECALTAHRALYGQGYSRTDMILKDDEFYILETNTIPGMTATSLFPQSAQVAGLSFGALLDRLIELGIQARRRTSTSG